MRDLRKLEKLVLEKGIVSTIDKLKDGFRKGHYHCGLIDAIQENNVLKQRIQRWWGDADHNFAINSLEKQTDFNFPLDWVTDERKDYNYLWRKHSFLFIPSFISAYEKESDLLKKEIYLEVIFKEIKNWADCFIYNDCINLFAWNDHATSNRLENLSYFCMYLIYNNKGSKEIYDICLLHMYILSLNKFYSIKTNHGLLQSNSLYIASCIFYDKNNKYNFHDLALSRLRFEYLYSFRDGVHVENSPEYHYVFLRSLIVTNNFINEMEQEKEKKFLFLEEYENIVDKALEFLSYIIRPDRKLPYIGDTEDKDILSFRLNVQNRSYKNFLYNITNGKEGELSNINNYISESTGWVIIQSERNTLSFLDRIHLVLKNGFLSKYHRQDDDACISLFAYGEEWLCDGGLYRHEHHDPIREFMRSRYSHNIMAPLNCYIERQIVPHINKPKFKSWFNSQNLVFLELETYMFSQYLYNRKLTYKEETRILIEDTLFNPNRIEDQVVVIFNIPNDKVISISENKIIVSSRKNNKKMILCFESDNIFLVDFYRNLSDISHYFKGVRSLKYNVLEEMQTIIVKFSNKSEEVYSLRTTLDFS